MNELKHKDVMRALECCKGGGNACVHCVYFYRAVDSSCAPFLIKDALALIRELTEEKERLHASCTELTQCCTKLETLYKVARKRADTAKADTVRKMQKKIKAKILEINHNLCGLLPFIDRVAKELLEES